MNRSGTKTPRVGIQYTFIQRSQLYRMYRLVVMQSTYAEKPQKAIIISSNFDHHNPKQECMTSTIILKIKVPTGKISLKGLVYKIRI